MPFRSKISWTCSKPARQRTRLEDAGSRMFAHPRMLVPVNDLIKGMIVQSGNDATMALAEGVGGSCRAFC